jgi:hypothetical protein
MSHPRMQGYGMNVNKSFLVCFSIFMLQLFGGVYANAYPPPKHYYSSPQSQPQPAYTGQQIYSQQQSQQQQATSYVPQVPLAQNYVPHQLQHSQIASAPYTQPIVNHYGSSQAQYATQYQPQQTNPMMYAQHQQPRGFIPGTVTKTSVFRLEKEHTTKEANTKDITNSGECGIAPPQISRYVANGKSTENRHWPWHVQIVINAYGDGESETYCGGTLINKRFVLTAAHCYDDVLHSKRAKSTMLVFKGLDFGGSKTGRKDAVRLKAKAVHIHPKYVPAMTEYEAKIKG